MQTSIRVLYWSEMKLNFVCQIMYIYIRLTFGKITLDGTKAHSYTGLSLDQVYGGGSENN